MKALLAALLILSACSSLSSCRVGVAVFKGGDVISDSGTRDCAEGRTCEFQVNDTDFVEVFTAQAKPGYEFVKWRQGDGYLCGDSTLPTCTVTNVAGAGNTAVEAVVASDEMFYVVPEFECVLESCPDILLDSVLLELQDQSRLIEAYVAQTGSYPVETIRFGLNTYYRPPPSLIHWIEIQPTFPAPGASVYLVAAVRSSLWDGSDPNSSGVAYFSLSGSTHWDNTMLWDCIPSDSGPGPRVPARYLPVECRG